MTRLFEKVPIMNKTIWLPGHLLCRLNERDGLSGGAGTGGAVSHYHADCRSKPKRIAQCPEGPECHKIVCPTILLDRFFAALNEALCIKMLDQSMFSGSVLSAFRRSPQLIGLVGCAVPTHLKAELLRTLTALAR